MGTRIWGLFLVVLLAVAAIGPARADDAAPADPVAPAQSGDDWVDSGRLLATAGVSQLEGAGGGGLASWAVITGYGTRDAVGANAHLTTVLLPGFTVQSLGVGVGLFNRLELSYAHLWFDTDTTGQKLGLGSGFTFQEDVLGAKLRLIGDAVYDQDRWLPQIALGTEFKSTDQEDVLRAIGARRPMEVDFYLAATKLFLAQSILVNATIRETKANQFGILGFGGDKSDDYKTEFEGSAAYLVTRQLAIGAEYRTKPDNLSFAKEDNVYDVFLAYFFNKNLSATLAFVALGDIAQQKNQDGAYLSFQAGF